MRVFTIITLLVTSLMVTGCSEQAEYKGSSPSIRSTKDQAGLRDYYVGLDYKWALDRPSSNTITPTPEPRILTPSPIRNDVGDRFGSTED